MSEHYDFHYQPTGSGAISGQQVLWRLQSALKPVDRCYLRSTGFRAD